MTERPIIFSAPMVRALLAGTKTQTRRVVQPQPQKSADAEYWSFSIYDHGYGTRDAESMTRYLNSIMHGPAPWRPYGAVGGRLWVREGHAIVPRTAYHHDLSIPHRESPDGHSWAVYREGWERCQPGPWRSPIHLPRWASRITLELTGVRVERLHDITEADAQAEGVELLDCTYINRCQSNSCPRHGVLDPYRHAYRATWESIHGRGAWEHNPFVWVLEFRRGEPGNA